MSTGSAAAPAKLNLGLRVGPPRADGYHPIESVFVPLALEDTLRFSIPATDEIAVTVRGVASGGIPADRDNLVGRAAAAFFERAGLPPRLEVALEKRIPSPGGLGGGSSDAGATLRWLAAAHPGRLSADELATLAVSLGADVPFFLDPTPALVEGIGECRQPLAGIPSLAVVWAHPGGGDDDVSLPTPRVYAAFDELGGALTPSGAAPSIRRLLELEARDSGVADPADGRSASARFEASEAGWLRQLLVNDLEPAATHLCPSVGRLREAIEASGALASAMSGSGPTVYGVFPDDAAAADAAASLRGRAARVEQSTTIPSRGT